MFYNIHTTVHLGYYFCIKTFLSIVAVLHQHCVSAGVAQGLQDIYTYSISRQWSILNSNSVEIYCVRMNIAYSTITHRDMRKHAMGRRICIS